MSGCRKNERNSQKELYNLLRGFAMKICYRYTNAMEECEEIVNEGFVKLFKNIHQFDETRQEDTLLSLKGWFKRILINTCIDHYRKANSSVNGHVLTNHESETIPDHGETGILASPVDFFNAARCRQPDLRSSKAIAGQNTRK